MENSRSIAIALVTVAMISSTHAQNRPVDMDGPTLIALFEGHSVSGAYVEGKPFRETYAVSGAIDYWDSDVTTTGQWSVANDLLCTFYAGLNGGCFRVRRISSNCFDYYTATTEPPSATPPAETAFYTARGALTHLPSTCPVELQT
jgi:hypothetical protein